MQDDRPAVKTTAAIEMEKTITYSSKLAVRFSPAMVILTKGKVKLSIKRAELTDIAATLRRLEDLEQAEAFAELPSSVPQAPATHTGIEDD